MEGYLNSFACSVPKFRQTITDGLDSCPSTGGVRTPRLWEWAR